MNQFLRVLCCALISTITVFPVFGATIGGSGFCNVINTGRSGAICDSVTAEEGLRGTTVSGSAEGFWREEGGGGMYANGVASYEARYAYGDLGLDISTELVSSNGLPVESHTGAIVGFHDFIMATSDSLSVGSVVPIRLTYRLSGAGTFGGIVGGFGVIRQTHYLSADLVVSGTDASYNFIYGDPNYVFNSPLYTPIEKPEVFIEKTIELIIGSATDLFSGLGAQIDASATQPNSDKPENTTFDGRILASNSAHVYFTPLVDGVTIRSDSGHDYALPRQSIPEPGTRFCILSGLLLIGGIRFGKRGHRFADH
jgi:hypothetical protein